MFFFHDFLCLDDCFFQNALQETLEEINGENNIKVI